jgi:hypothetical protein
MESGTTFELMARDEFYIQVPYGGDGLQEFRLVREGNDVRRQLPSWALPPVLP